MKEEQKNLKTVEYSIPDLFKQAKKTHKKPARQSQATMIFLLHQYKTNSILAPDLKFIIKFFPTFYVFPNKVHI